ncbi:hypothetical protein LWI28_024090 [Acer negundo]|uniref:Uncharacterized protein n=1 Tax=Acer negundo TaxID=4023 RepID=A0AAD5J604_ACENE|nr:hypothetical protein LWI28_024090 [Acer negundo]
MVRKLGTSSSIGSSSLKSGYEESTQIDHSRFAINDVRENKIDKAKLVKIGTSSSIGSSSLKFRSEESTQGPVEEPSPGECREGYNSEDFIRDKIDHSGFAINNVRENKIDKAKLVKIAT